MSITVTFARAALALGLVFAPVQGWSQSIVSTGQSFLDARMLPGSRQDDGTRLAGLRMSVADGWKTYWRDPGEAGIPPWFDWSGSDNVASVEVMWPRPEVFMSFGMRTVGYSGDLVLPLRVTPQNGALPMSVALHARIGVCREICVIEDVELSEQIAPDLRPIGSKQIRRAVASVPMPAVDAGMRLAVCRIEGTGRDRQMQAEFTFDADPGQADVLVEGHEHLWVRKTAVERDGDSLRLAAQLRLPKDVSWVDRSSVRMTVLAENFAADVQGCVPSG